jgi:pimeloyl-ACP methyl ester carboxylesterase
MHTVTSADGTHIAYRRSGEGPSLLLVHGAGTDHHFSWKALVPVLEPHFTVYAMDRRGRGSSGDAAGYDVEREVEDVLAVLDVIGPGASILGHSFGAHLALEAALRVDTVRRLVLYEGIELRGVDRYREGLLDELDARLARGDVERMLVAMMREVVGRSDDEIADLQADEEGWSARLAYAPTMPRELRADAEQLFDPERFRGMRVPTLLVVGGDSGGIEHRNAREVAAGLPDARVAVLPGQRHIAMITAPHLLADEVVRFALAAPSR